MKKYTHAWIVFKAVERLGMIPEDDPNRRPAQTLVDWFMGHRDGVISGAWYPDSIIKDTSTGHVLKMTPNSVAPAVFPALTTGMQLFRLRTKSPCWQKGYLVAAGDNLPERCEALAHEVNDNLKVQQAEAKGSPVAPTGDHISLVLFMLSHYVADAHVPLHCDGRRFLNGHSIHCEMEGAWEDAVLRSYALDTTSDRFFYTEKGYPLIRDQAAYDQSVLKRVQTELAGRRFDDQYGIGNTNVPSQYLNAVCRYSYLLPYSFIHPVSTTRT